MKVEREIEIAASPEAIYDVVMDPARLGEWVTIHAGLKDAPNAELRQGSHLTQCLKVAGQRFDVRWTVAEAKRPSRVVWEGKGPVRSRARTVYELHGNRNGTRFSYLNEYTLPGGPLGRLGGRVTGPASAREAERTLRQLKALVEG